MVNGGVIESYQINADGSANIKGDVAVQGRFEEMGLPKLNHVEGSFEWYFVPADYNPLPHLPKTISDSCECPGNNLTIRSSQLPRNTTGRGVLKIGSGCKVALDSDAPFTFEEFFTGNDSYFTSGFEHMPREFDKMDYVDIKTDDITGLPPYIKCRNFTLTVSSSTALKGFNKHVKSIEAENQLIVKFPEKSPLLGVLQAVKSGTLFTAVTDWSLNGPDNQRLRRTLFHILKAEPAMDMFEMQEAMIEAGFGQFAKA
jgi:hypothetical protein